MILARRSLLTSLASLSLATSAHAQGRGGSKDAVHVPFARDSGMVTVDIQVDGRKGLAAIDNGAAYSLIDQRFAAVLGKTAESRARINGGSARVAGAITVDVGGKPIATTPVITDLTMIAGALGRPVVMVLGYEMFAACVVQFDFETSQLTLHPPGTRGPFIANRTDLVALPGRKFAAPLRIGDARPVPAMIDLGAASALAISTNLAEKLGLLSRQPQTSAAASVFIGDQPRMFYSRLITAPRLVFAGAALTGAPLEILAADEPVFSRYGATVGASVLSRFDLWLDLPGRRMWTRPNRFADGAFERDRIGLQGYMDGDGFRIMHVREKSPAWQAGLSPRDRVEAVNGKPAGDVIPELKYAAPSGKAYELRLAGGRTVSLTAEDYY